MAQSTFSIRMDNEVKKMWDFTCKELGLTVSAVVNILARKMIREQRIPFEVSNESYKQNFRQRETLTVEQRIAREALFAKYNFNPNAVLTTTQEKRKLDALRVLDEIAGTEKADLPLMSLEEINEEITQAREDFANNPQTQDKVRRIIAEVEAEIEQSKRHGE